MPPAIASLPAFIVASVIAEIAVWLLTVLAFGALILVVVVIKNPNIVGRGQDAAGKGMAAGCTVLLGFIAAIAFGVIATITVFNTEPPASLAARIAAPIPEPVQPTVESKPDPGSTADGQPKAADETRIAPERGERAV